MSLAVKKENHDVVLRSLATLKNYLECPICLEILEDISVVPSCQHRFCGPCIQESLRKCNNECPTCRAHVPTRRSLRTDEVFESLVRSLTFILEPPNTDDNDGLDFNATFESLKSLKWHFLCPVCNDTLKSAHISSECLHRVCKSCIEDDGMRSQCPCCKLSSSTLFSIDKQFDEIVQAVEEVILCFENEGYGAKDSIDMLPDPVISQDPYPIPITSDENIATGESQIDEQNLMMAIDELNGNDDSSEDGTNAIPDSTGSKSAIITATPNEDNTAETKASIDNEAEVKEPKKEKKGKYPRGTYFKDSNDKFARVVGFDGQSYKIFYPKDGNCGLMLEEDFDKVEIIPAYKRPARNQRQTKKDNVPRCSNCQNLFSSDFKDKKAGTLPIQSQKCAHVICFDCVQSLRTSSGKGKNTNLRNTVDCPICKKKQAFNGKDPTICLAMCQVVSLYNRMKGKRKHRQLSSRHKERDAHDRKKKSKRSEDKAKQSKKPTKHEASKKEGRSRKLKTMKCTTCVKDKRTDKFSSKQLKKGIDGSRKVLCRRCEEKGKIQSRWGSGYEKYCTTVSVAKTENSKPSFLTTILPWRNGVALKLTNTLPSDLIINGYSREPFSRLSNEDIEQEAAWTKGKMWFTGEGIHKFLRFLQESKKSAYGTFLLPSGIDGFFVIPYDQPPPKDIFICKFVLDVGVILKDAEQDDSGGPSIAVGNGQDEKKSSLRNLLKAEYKTSQSLDEVRQGTVKAKKISQGPEAPPASHGPADWFRERVVIVESDDEDVDRVEEDVEVKVEKKAAGDAADLDKDGEKPTNLFEISL